MSTVPRQAEYRTVLEPVSWATYCAIVDETKQSGRITYDQGLLEILSPLMPHESAKSLIARMICRYTEIHDIDMRSSASTTFRREDLERGFEADESYYIQNCQAIRGKAEVDLTIDPPPDLVVEIDMTNSSIDKLRLFASMEIPEVWRYDGVMLWIGNLHEDSYAAPDESRLLPGFPVSLAQELLAQRAEASETNLMRLFAESVRNACDR